MTQEERWVEACEAAGLLSALEHEPRGQDHE